MGFCGKRVEGLAKERKKEGNDFIIEVPHMLIWMSQLLFLIS